MKFGIIQGRLLPPVENKIQEFPFNDWEKEFLIIKDLNLNHIEFIVTKNSFDNFLNIDLSKYSKFISGICCDNFIDIDFYKLDFIEKNIVPICNKLQFLDIRNIHIPLLEDSEILEKNKQEFFNNILKISNNFPNINFHFEMESKIEVALELVNLSDKFYFIYDTGNLNFISVKHVDYIDKIIHKISNVHLKDRNNLGSHYPGKGTTNFREIFETLKKNDYDGYFTIQTKRGTSGEEIKTISEHFDYFKTLLNSIL
jgi:sugar phosphate isomerase/epimerase